MAKYPRILVRYRLPNTDQWSDLQWCDIQRTGEGDVANIEVRIAQATPGGAMPAESQFALLDSLAAKLWVIDIKDDTFYCLAIVDNIMYRFNFDPSKEIVYNQGTSWDMECYFNSSISIHSRKVFSISEFHELMQLVKKPSELEQYNLIQYPSGVLSNLKAQFSEWCNQRTMTSQQQEDQTGQKLQNLDQQCLREREPLATGLEQWHIQPVDIDASLVNSSLDDLDRLMLHAPICDALFQIKSLVNNSEHYQEILFHLVSQTLISNPASADINNKLRSFQTRFLRNSYELNELFRSQDSLHPTLATVYNYVLDVVLLELQNYDAGFCDQESHSIKATCPESYGEIRLGVTQRITLIQDVADSNADARLAAGLQMQEIVDAGDEMLAAVLQSRDQMGTEERLAPESAATTQRRFPQCISLDNTSLGLFAPQSRIQRQLRVETASQYRRLVMLMLGGALCVMGSCIAFYALSPGLSLIAVGIGCLVTATFISRDRDNLRSATTPASLYRYP